MIVPYKLVTYLRRRDIETLNAFLEAEESWANMRQEISEEHNSKSQAEYYRGYSLGLRKARRIVNQRLNVKDCKE